jgi:U3 small nucleolar RNA-associated protein 20
LDDTQWRDELTTLDLSGIEPQDRSELVNVIIRILFGLMLERRGRIRGADRRAAVLGSLGGCTDQELGLLVDLMLKPIHAQGASHQTGTFTLRPVPDGISEKQQIGFLTLLGDVLKDLGPRLVSYWPALLGTTIDLIGGSQTRIEAARHHGEVLEEAVEGDEEDDVGERGSSSKLDRSVRQLGLKRFADFFRSPVTFDYTPFMKESFVSFISPRLSSLDKENTQAPSALLELFYAWTSQNVYVKFLVDFDTRTVPKIYNCLVATNVKPAVISRVYDIIERLLVLSTVDNGVLETVVKPHMSLLLTNLSILVERTKGVASVSSPLGQRQIGILSEIAQYSTDVNQAATLLGLFSPLLRKPSKILPEKVKINLLKILSNLLTLIPDLSDRCTIVYTKTYELLSQLFQNLRSRPARMGLLFAFQRFALVDSSLQPVATLLESLNAYSSRRMDEPDFDRRLNSFAELNEKQYKLLSLRDWLPLLYNMLHFIQDPTELAVRNNASFTLRHFVDLVGDVAHPEYEKTFMRVLYPGMKNGLRSRNEMVRAEVLGVIAYAVTRCDRISSLQEMRVLLAGGDEEANFFNNIHHVQIHRRTRALRRLADQCDEGHICSNTLAEIFVPLVGNYITTTASLDHHLVNEAIVTTGRMAKHLTWGAYYALVQKYLRASRAKDESERVYVRTLVAILDNFHYPMEEIIPDVEKPAEDDGEDGEECDNTPLPPIASNATISRRITEAVSLHLLPSLLEHLEKRDATTEDITRIPIAIGIVKVAMHLPASTREPQISRLLTILSQILRSRSQDTRDHIRDTLCRMTVNLGPSYLPLIFREMRAALLRGPQLHVLAYLTHALLSCITNEEHAGSFHTLDECVNDVAHISAEVIFGESGKGVQAEEFKTKMREVRASSAKSLDSFAIIAKYITPPKISSLLVPLRSIMQETQSVKVMQLVDDVLRRVVTGLNANNHLVHSELLVLCHTLISQNARFLKEAPSRRKGPAKGDLIVQTKRQVAMEDNHYSNNSFRYERHYRSFSPVDILPGSWRLDWTY